MVCQTYHPPKHADYHQKRRIIPSNSNSLVQARQAGGYAGQARPGYEKKSVLQSSPREDWNFCDIGATNVKETRLGEPVLGEPVLIGRAIKRGWGEPVQAVGRATRWALGNFHSQRLLGCGASARAVPAGHV